MPCAASASPTALPAPPATTFSSIVTSAVVVQREARHEIDVERLDEAHVRHRRVELLRGAERRLDHAAEREDRDPVRPPRRRAAHLALAHRQRGHGRGDRNAGTAAARIANRRRRVEHERRVEHLPAFVLVRGRHHGHVGKAAQVRKVEGAVVRRAVGADESRPVDREHDGQILQRHVVDQLIVAALQERRIDGDDGLHAVAREARGEGHRMLLGDADVEVAIGKFLREADEPRAFAHRRRDPDEARIRRRHVAAANRRRRSCTPASCPPSARLPLPDRIS